MIANECKNLTDTIRENILVFTYSSLKRYNLTIPLASPALREWKCHNLQLPVGESASVPSDTILNRLLMQNY